MCTDPSFACGASIKIGPPLWGSRPDTSRPDGAARAACGHVFALRQSLPRDHFLRRLQSVCKERVDARARSSARSAQGSAARKSLQPYLQRAARARFEPAELTPRAPAACLNGGDDGYARLITVISEIATQTSDHKGGKNAGQVAPAPRLPSRPAPSTHLLPRQSTMVRPQAF